METSLPTQFKMTTIGEKPNDVNNACIYVFYPNGDFAEKHLSDTFSVGSSAGGGVDILIDSAAVSSEHGEFLIAPKGYMYRDLFSKNGTYINGIKYGDDCDKQGKLLEHGDVLKICDGNVNVAGSQAVTMVYTSSDEELVWFEQRLDDSIGEIEIGRCVESGIKFSDTSISRKHATFKRGINGWCVIDHNSKNGVYVNGAINSETATTLIEKNDIIRIASIIFVFLGDKLLYCLKKSDKPAEVVIKEEAVPVEEPAAEEADVWENQNETAETESLTEPKTEVVPPVKSDAPKAEEQNREQLMISIRKRTVKKLFHQKTLLEDINLSIASGNLVLILGGSGAGKTTFLKAVLGYEKADGDITFDNTNIYTEYNKVKNLLGYATQECLLRESATVWDTLYQAAEMRMPMGTSKSEITSRVNEVLELLGLQRETKTQVKNLSGGQQKRLGIAVEYISNPKVFFLDEPDSGLDGMMAIDLMRSLRVMADDNKIVMVISHAPDRVATLFDKVIVLAKSVEKNCGQLAFYGSIDEAKAFFDVNALELIVRRINRPDENGEGLSDFYINKFKEYRRA